MELGHTLLALFDSYSSTKPKQKDNPVTRAGTDLVDRLSLLRFAAALASGLVGAVRDLLGPHLLLAQPRLVGLTRTNGVGGGWDSWCRLVANVCPVQFFGLGAALVQQVSLCDRIGVHGCEG